MTRIFWTGYSKKERIAVISEIEKIVNTYGFITDFKQFSDISLSLTIEIEDIKIMELYSALSKNISLDEYKISPLEPNNECVIFLNLTFIKGKGNMKHEIPNVPG